MLGLEARQAASAVGCNGEESMRSRRRRQGCAGFAAATTSASSERQVPQRVPAPVQRMTSATEWAPFSTTLRISRSETASQTQTSILMLNIVFKSSVSRLRV